MRATEPAEFRVPFHEHADAVLGHKSEHHLGTVERILIGVVVRELVGEHRA